MSSTRVASVSINEIPISNYSTICGLEKSSFHSGTAFLVSDTQRRQMGSASSLASSSVNCMCIMLLPIVCVLY